MKNGDRIRKIYVVTIALVLIISLLIPAVGSINISAGGFKPLKSRLITEKQYNNLGVPFADVWDVTLEFNEPGGAYDNAIFGEKTDASDGLDSYDVPKSIPSFPPYIRGWFPTTFPDPHDELWEEYKHYPDDYKTWNLTIQWVPSDYTSPTTVTISWDNTSFSDSDYVYVSLFSINNNATVSDMLANSSYVFTCPALTLQNFQIICTANIPPIANDDSDTVDEDTNNNQIDVLSNDNDPNGDELNITGVTQPTNGVASFTTDYVYYTPDLNYNGPDSFSYTISDGEGGTDTAVVNITVTPVNDPPEVSNIPDQTIDEGQTFTTIQLDNYVTDPDNTDDQMNWTYIGNTDLTISIDINRNVTISIPDPDWFGTEIITFNATDPLGLSDEDPATFTVNNINDPPIIYNDNYTTIEDTTLYVPAPGILENDFDADNDTLIVEKLSDPTHGTLTFYITGAFVYAPVENYTGIDSFTYRAYDGEYYSNTATVQINITATSDPPVANDDYYTTNEDTTLNIPAPGVLFNDSDPDNDPLTAILVTLPSNGQLTLNSNGSFIYIPNSDYNGVDNFTYKASDGISESNNATVHLTIISVNDPPVAPNNPIPANGATDIDINVDLSWSCSDPENDTLTYDVYFGTSSPPPLITNNQTSSSYNPGTLIYNTQYYWRIVAWDYNGGSNTSPIWNFITSAEPNNPPIAPYNPNPANGATDIDININLSWICSDPDNDTLTYDIYFGTSSQPPLITTGHTETIYYPGILDFNTMYYWKVKVWDNHSASNESPIWDFTTRSNSPPDIPEKPSGPIEGKTGEELEFSTITNDTDGDQIYYWFDWGNGENSGWVGSYQSNQTVYQSYIWSDPGVYEVRVKAMDNYSQESGWSEILSVQITQKGSLEVIMISGGFFQVSALIKNVALEDITNVNWSIGLAAGLILTGFISSGTIDHIPPGGVVVVYSDTIIGFGLTRITVSAETDGSIPDVKDTDALMLVIYNWILS